MKIQTITEGNNYIEMHLLTERNDYAGQLIIKNDEMVKEIRATPKNEKIHIVLLEEEKYKEWERWQG